MTLEKSRKFKLLMNQKVQRIANEERKNGSSQQTDDNFIIQIHADLMHKAIDFRDEQGICIIHESKGSKSSRCRSRNGFIQPSHQRSFAEEIGIRLGCRPFYRWTPQLTSLSKNPGQSFAMLPEGKNQVLHQITTALRI